MTDEQINEVMRLADEIADYAWKQGLSDGAYSQADHDRKSCDASRAALEAHLRTIGEPAGYSLPAGSIGAKKFAQVGGGFTPVGLVFSRGESAMAITEHGRVYWDRDLAHPNGSKPESVNAELLAIVHQTVGMIENTSIETGCCCCGDGMDGHASPLICGHSATDQGAYLAGLLYEDAKAAIARAESAIETPAKVSPCAGNAVQQEADEAGGA